MEFIEVKDKDKKKFSWRKVLFLIFAGLFILSLIDSIVFIYTPKIEVISLKGVISTSKGYSIYGDVVSSREIANEIYRAADDNSVKGIIMDINSPGGSPVASDEISRAIEYAEGKGKKVVAVIGDLGTSGAYWVAASTNKIFVSPMSIVGSIGVTSAGLSFEDFLKRYNITYRRLVSGKYKDIGTPFRKMTPEEEKIIESMLNDIHTRFIKHVAEARGLNYTYVKNLSDGRFYLGDEAVELGLVDDIGYYEDVVKYMKNLTGANMIYEYKPPISFWESLKSVFGGFRFDTMMIFS